MARLLPALFVLCLGCPLPEGWEPLDTGRIPLPRDTGDTAEPVVVCEGAWDLGYVSFGYWTTFGGELTLASVTSAAGSCVGEHGGLEGAGPWPYQIWAMSGDAGQTYRAEIWTDSFEPTLVVADSSCGCLAWGDGGAGQHGADYAMPADGWVHLFVASRTPDGVGSYTIHTPYAY